MTILSLYQKALVLAEDALKGHPGQELGSNHQSFNKRLEVALGHLADGEEVATTMIDILWSERPHLHVRVRGDTQ